MLVYPAGFPSGVEDGGNINIIRGAHLYCDTTAESADVSPASQSGMSVSGSAANDRAMEEGWMKGKVHPVTGQPLRCERLDLPPGSLICCNTRAPHPALTSATLTSLSLRRRFGKTGRIG